MQGWIAGVPGRLHVGTMMHDHQCSGGDDHGFHRASRRSLTSALVLIVGYMFAEVIGGLISGSLALLADAGHMLSDAASIGLALVALHFAARPASARHTFGYHRLEILAALANALTLWFIAAWVVFEAYERFQTVPDVAGGTILIIGTVGLLVNAVAAWILHRPAKESLNVEGAFVHVMADLLGSLGVVISGVFVWAFGWTIVDPILSVVICILILVSTWRLLRKVINILLQGVPEHLDLYRLCHELEEVSGVRKLHDIHVWNLASGYDVLTAHVLVEPSYSANDYENLKDQLREIATSRFNIHHVTLQIESSHDRCREDHRVDPVRSHEEVGIPRRLLSRRRAQAEHSYK